MMMRYGMLRHKVLFGATMLIAAWWVVPAVHAQGITSEQAQQILNELKAIRQTLERQPVAPALPGMPPPVSDKVSLQLAPGGYSIGRSDAPLTIVEYTDYQCPFCQQFHIATFDQIKKNYVDSGKVRYVSRDFPLSQIHPNAQRAALAARCAGDQGKFWELRHTMIVNANQLGRDNIVGYAKDLGLDDKKFNACLDGNPYQADIDRNLAEGAAAGVNGTPSFVIGRLDKDNKFEGVRMVGAMPYAQFDAKIKELLAQSGKN